MSDGTMERIVVAAPTATAEKLQGILSAANLKPDAVYAAGAEALAAVRREGAVMLTTWRLSDMTGSELAERLGDAYDVLMIVPPDYQETPGDSALALRNPVSPDALLQSVRTMRYCHGRMNELRFKTHKLERALEDRKLIDRAKERGERIAIASDFDCDGIFSAYILWKGFGRLGMDSRIYTPDRVKEGYGLNERIVREACADGRSLLVTCDNGIAAKDEVKLARQMGMTVLVTDHHEVQGELPEADAVICFGGDGTILHMAKAATRCGKPVLGVNIGTMGFMAELESTELDQLPRLTTGDFTLDSRMMLDVSVQRGRDILFHDICLNDAVVTKGAVARIIQLAVKCDGVECLEFGGDGLIIATPTGSTAYSLSAGGPIVEPEAANILITPICAHDVGSRCVVASDQRVVTVSLGKNARRNAFLSVDGGKALRLEAGDVATVRKSQLVTKLIRLKSRSFYDVLNMKFK